MLPDAEFTERARQLRREETDAERKLWWRLRARQIHGAKFRRQYVVGPYIVDFCCPDLKLVVELDGGQHLGQVEADQRRTAYLANQGYRVLRFWDNDVLTNIESVLDAIAEALQNPHPHPLPTREREFKGRALPTRERDLDGQPLPTGERAGASDSLPTRERGVEKAGEGPGEGAGQFDGLIRAIRRQGDEGTLVHQQIIPPRHPDFLDPSPPLPPPLADALRSQGIARLYRHQAEALAEARAGRNVLVVTGTASGKSLAYQLPVLETLLREPEARALFLFPTKALEQDQLKSLQECVETLIETVGGDGNLLLNVGPMPDGRIEPRQVDRLKELGAWLAKYGEGIYGTRGGPFVPGEWGASTCKDDSVYLFVTRWPAEGPLKLPPMGRKILDAQALGRQLPNGEKALIRQTESGVTVDVPKSDRDEIATVVVLTVDGQATEIPPVKVP